MITLRHSFNVRCLASQVAILKNAFLCIDTRNLTTKKKEEKEEDFEFVSFDDPEDPEEIAAKEALIEQKRNKSKLFPPDFNRQHDRPPYDEPQFEFHESLYYRRRLYGKFGEASKVNPSILWPSKKELALMKEFDEVSQPYTFHELVARAKEKKELKEKERQAEEAEIMEKVQNIKKEILEFHKRAAAKKKVAEELIAKKNKLVEEVRRHFGYKIDVRDQKFKDMLEKMQLEDRKKRKEAKKAIRLEKIKAEEDAVIKEQEERAKAREEEESEEK